MAEELPIGAVIGAVLGATIGFIVLLICTYKFIRCCLRRRHKAKWGSQYDLEQPFTNGGSTRSLDGAGRSSSKGRGGGLPTIKESELVTSPNVVAELDDMDALAMNGLPVSHGPNGKLQLVAPADNGDMKARQGSGPMSILRWLESSDATEGDVVAAAPAGLTHTSSLPPGPPRSGSPGDATRSRSFGSKLSALSMKALAERLQSGGDLADMKRKLLAATNSWGGDSSAHPLDVKGVVFNRLPPSRRASPAPSTIESVVRTPRISRPWEQGDHMVMEQLSNSTQRSMLHQSSSARNGAGPTMGGPPSRSSSMTREGAASPALPLGSHGGTAYAAIGTLARNSLKRSMDVTAGAEGLAGLPPRPPRSATVPRSSQGVDSGVLSPNPSMLITTPSQVNSPFLPPPSAALILGSSGPDAASQQGVVPVQLDAVGQSNYHRAMAALEQAAGTASDAQTQVQPAAGLLLPVSVPAGEQPMEGMDNPVFQRPV